MRIESGKIAIYVHRKQDTMQPFYIGLGVGNRPWSFHKRSAEWKETSITHGVIVEILETVEDRSIAEVIEECYISRFGRAGIDNNGILVNKSRGGEGAYLPKSEEWRKKISESKKGKPFSKEHIEKIALSRIGKKHSEEWKRKASEKRRGRKMPEWFSETVKIRQVGGGNSSARKVIDTSTGRIYGCIKDCAIDIDISQRRLYHMLSGHTKNITSCLYYRD